MLLFSHFDMTYTVSWLHILFYVLYNTIYYTYYNFVTTYYSIFLPCARLRWHEGGTRVGWLTGLARVGEVQPGPVPAKPVPVRVRVQTRTVYPRVSSNTAGTRKPVQLFCYFVIFS